MRTARELRFTLTEGCAPLLLADSAGRSYVDVDALAQAHLSQVEETLHQHKSLRGERTRVIALCEGAGTVVDCTIHWARGGSARTHERAPR